VSDDSPKQVALCLDADQRWTLERAADLLEAYAEQIKAAQVEALELHPYLPEVNLVAGGLRELTQSDTAHAGGPRGRAGPELHRLAERLLRQLDDNRPRRALNLDEVRHLLELLTEKSDAATLVAMLIRSAWEWGASCEVDGVRWGEAGDSHNQMWRDKTADAAKKLEALIATQSSKQSRES
jgi:hypothetical protein